MINPPLQSAPVETDALPRKGTPGSTPSSADFSAAQTPETLELVEETLQVAKREVVAGTVRVSTRTESFEEVAEVSLDRNIVDVTRVAVGKIVDHAPAVRTEGDTTIVPVMEERFVVVKQLYLLEELHIRHRVETEVSHVPVTLRRQTAVVERIDGDGRVLPDMDNSQAK